MSNPLKRNYKKFGNKKEIKKYIKMRINAQKIDDF